MICAGRNVKMVSKLRMVLKKMYTLQGILTVERITGKQIVQVANICGEI